MNTTKYYINNICQHNKLYFIGYIKKLIFYRAFYIGLIFIFTDILHWEDFDVKIEWIHFYVNLYEVSI